MCACVFEAQFKLEINADSPGQNRIALPPGWPQVHQPAEPNLPFKINELNKQPDMAALINKPSAKFSPLRACFNYQLKQLVSFLIMFVRL